MRDASKDKATRTYEHPWDFELREHVLEQHAAQLAKALRPVHLGTDIGWDVYKEALSVQERNTRQIAGGMTHYECGGKMKV